MVKHGKARAEETSGGSVNAVFRLNGWLGGNGGSTTNFFYNKLLISQYFAKREQHLPIGGSAPLKFAMLISKRRMSGWAGGKKTILET